MNSESYIVTKSNDEYEIHDASILNKYAIKESKALEIEDEFDYDQLLEPPADPRQLNKLLRMNTWHRRCCDIISRDATGDNWTLIPCVENPSEDQKIRATEFFENIRPSINEVLAEREYDCEADGWGLIEVIRENGRDSPVIDLKHFSAYTFRRHQDGVRVKQMVGSKERWFVIMGRNKDEYGNYYDVNAFTGEISTTPLPEEERANEVIWKNRYTPGTKYYGEAPIIPSISAIYGDEFRAQYNSSFFKNYGMPTFAVTVTGDFDPGINDPSDPDYDFKNTLKYRISQSLKEVIRNPHSAMVLEIPSEGEEGNVEVNIQPLSVETKEASFRLFRKDNRDEVIASHGVDPSRLNIAESGQLNGSNSVMLDSAYINSIIKPLMRSNEDDINYYILKLGLEITDWKFKLLDNDDDHKEVEIDNIIKLVQNALMTPNEAREFIGEPFGIASVDDWLLDQYYYMGKPLGDTTENDDLGVLDNLENTLIQEAEGLDEQIRREEKQDNDDGFKNKASQKNNPSITGRIKEAFKNRKSVN